MHDFRGTFRGAGQDATSLEPFERFAVSQDEVAIGRPLSAHNPWPFHVTFVDGDVTVSDLTFRMTAFEPAQPWTLFGMEFSAMASSPGVLSRNTVGAIVQDNVMRGTARAGIEIGVTPDDEPAPPVAQWLVAANDLSSLTVSEAMVVLGPGSQDTAVVCTVATTFRDEGSGNRVDCDL